MDFIRKYSLMLGLSILIAVAVLLLSSSDLLFSSGVTFIDTDIRSTTGNELYVKTKADFGNIDYMDDLPTQMGEWRFGQEYPVDQRTYDQLGADLIEMRSYTKAGSYNPLFLAIVQAKTNSSFHPPEICYPAQGYKIESQGKDEVLVTDTKWTEEGGSSVAVPVRKLVVYKETNGMVNDRRVVLYWYVRGNQFTSDTITMIRISARTVNTGPYDTLLEQERDFIAAAIPHLFDPGDDKTWEPIVYEMAGWGAGGYILIAVLLLVPMGIIVYPRTPWGRGRAS